MATHDFQLRQLTDELSPPETGKLSRVLADDNHCKVILFAFAADEGLAEHVAPHTAIIQIIRGEAQLTVGDQAIAGRPGTWIKMLPATPHSIRATTPLWMLLTLLK